jgi:serine/threonine protein kinase
LLELSEGNPPHYNVHPMRAIFIISSRPAPTLKEPDKWSPDMVDFLGRCLVKNCEQRATAAELLKHPWLRRTVKEIGPHANGLTVLRDLVQDNWAEIERVRCSRLNIPVEGASQDGMHESLTAHIMQQLNPAAAAYALGSGSVGAELESLGSERSLYDDSTLRTVSRNSSFGGVAATRQQLRNRTLSRSNSRSSTPISTPGKPGANRGRLFNAPPQAIGAQYSFDSTDNASPKHSNGQTGPPCTDAKLHPDAKTDFKPLRHETPQRGSNGWAKNVDRDLEETPDSSMTPAMQNSSMVRSPPVTKSPDGAPEAVAAPKAGGFMSALKYFQSEPIPATPAAVKATSSDYKTPDSKEGDGRGPLQSALPASVVRTGKGPTTVDDVLRTETEVLNDLTAQDEGSQNIIRKVNVTAQSCARGVALIGAVLTSTFRKY